MSGNLTNMSNIELSIIIVSYNTKKVTHDCIVSIYNSLKGKNPVSFEIIVVDNNSKDGSKEMLSSLSKEYSNLKYIDKNENLGFSKANNIGAHAAQGIYLLFLNSDIIVLDSAIETLLTQYKKNEDRLGFLGGKLLNKDLSPQPSCGPFYNLAVVFGALFLKGDYWGLTRYSPDVFQRTDWVSGACIMTKKEIFAQVGGFDEKIFMYMEEIDLLYRAKRQGYSTYFCPFARFIHLGSASSGGKTYPILQVYKGLLFFYRKHHNNKSLIFFLKIMLKLKSLIALTIGRMSKNQYLINTYEKANQLVEMA